MAHAASCVIADWLELHGAPEPAKLLTYAHYKQHGMLTVYTRLGAETIVLRKPYNKDIKKSRQPCKCSASARGLIALFELGTVGQILWQGGLPLPACRQAGQTCSTFCEHQLWLYKKSNLQTGYGAAYLLDCAF
jgi:hypothetical protein